MSNARGALCLTCRTALGPGEPCDASKHHKVVRLGAPAERRKALDAVWGPKHELRAPVRPKAADKLSAPRTSVIGTVVGANDEIAAWGVLLSHCDAWGETKVTLRDGGTAGLRLQLDDGQVVVVPAGRARVVGEPHPVNGTTIARHVDPEFRERDDHPVIAFDLAEEVVIRLIDRLELLGDLEARPDPQAQSANYREAPPTILVPTGVPWLRKV